MDLLLSSHGWTNSWLGHQRRQKVFKYFTHVSVFDETPSLHSCFLYVFFHKWEAKYPKTCETSDYLHGSLETS